MATEEYFPKSILFTGGAGFLGSNVLIHLMGIHKNTKFICLDSTTKWANLKNFEEVVNNPNFIFVHGDVTSADLLNHIMERYQIDTVMHFAAEKHISDSFGNSLTFTNTNVLGTHALLESAKLYMKQIKRFIHVSTDEVYGAWAEGANPSSVEDTLNPSNPYAASKAAAEFMVKSYRTSFKLPTIITRGNNVYGPKQHPDRLIPKFINLLDSKKPCPLHGDGSNKRMYLYIKDVAEAYDIILRKGSVGQIYNIGAKSSTSNMRVLDLLLEMFGRAGQKEQFVTYVNDRVFQDRRYVLDTKPLEALGWKQRVSFEEGLKLTREWYLNNPNWWGDISSSLQAHPTAGATATFMEKMANSPRQKAGAQFFTDEGKKDDGKQPGSAEKKRKR